jgi:hypothetical protein
MATLSGTTVNNLSGSGGSSWNVTRNITAGDLVVLHFTWEDSQTLSSVADTAGGTWAIATQQAHGSAPQPIGAIAYCLSHPGGTGVVITGTLSGAAAALLEADAQCFTPAGGTTFAADGTATPGTGNSGGPFSCGSTIVTTAAGVVVEFLAGFQLTTGVTTGGTPAFTRDTPTENASGRSFAQYLLSGSAQTVTPGASWTAFSAKWVMLAAAFKEVAVATNILMGQACL